MFEKLKKISFALKNLFLKGRVPWTIYKLFIKMKIMLYHIYYDQLILKTKPICAGGDNPYFAIHIMTRHSDIHMTLWAVKSFFRFTDKKYQVVLLTDHSLTKKDIEILSTHLIGVKFIFEEEAGKSIENKIADYPLIKLFRLPPETPFPVKFTNEILQYHFCPFSMKLLDGNFLSQAEKVMILDSDVLFFKKPTEILDWIENSSEDKSMYMVEAFQPSFDVNYRITFKLKDDPPMGINTGLFCYHKKIVDLPELEKWIDQYRKTVFTLRTAEQHAYGYLAQRYKHEPLPNTYSFNNRENASVATHFGIKHLYYQNLKDVYQLLRSQW